MANDTWYAAKLLFACEIEGDSNDDRLCEESIILVRGTDEASARSAAEQRGPP